MKFLCQHSRVRKELKSWAAEKRLVFAQFFFWNSGEKLQTSLEGLYRSLLFETLKQYPDLIPEIFPKEWDALDSATSRFESPSFRIAEIKAAFKKLVNRRTFPNHRLCFFIDGLDEYEGDSLEHWKLAESLQKWASSTDIKICVSSRPHTEFMQTFSDNSNFRLHLHELTRHDINRFASAMFEKDPNFDRVKDVYKDLVDQIVWTANGVFLWARLVVRSLLEGVGHHDSQSALQEKLNSIPKDLDEFFAKLLGSINPSDRKRSDQMLSIASGDAPLDPINALAYSWLEDLNDPGFPFSSPVQGYSDEEIRKRHHNLRPQLDSLSKGLLEMVPSAPRASEDIFWGYTVQFFHRTVRDYLRDDVRQSQFRSRLPAFNLHQVYLRLCLAELKFARTKKSYFEHCDNVLYQVFNSSHEWNSIQSDAGRKAPFSFAKEVSTVLNGYRQQSFLHPEVIGGKWGTICWSETLAFSGDVPISPNADMSYIHYAALFGEYQYVSLKISEDPTLLKGDCEMSILLSASIGRDPELVRFLLQAGADPQDQLKFRDQRNLDQRTTVWMLFLFLFAAHSLDKGLWINSDLFSLILEEYLKFEVDTDISFLIGLPSDPSKGVDEDICVMPNELAKGPREQKEIEQLEHVLFSISLEELVRLSEPKNLDSLLILLQEKAKRPFWSKTSSVISKFLPWIEPSTAIVPGCKTFEFKELENGKFLLHSVCSKTSQLKRGFQVRVC
jgi:hypothetical protein